MISSWSLRDPLAILPEIPIDTFRILPGFLKVFRRFFHDPDRIVSGSLKDSLRIISGRIENHMKILSGFSRDVFRILSGSFQDRLRIHSGSLKDDWRIVSGWIEDCFLITWIFFRDRFRIGIYQALWEAQDPISLQKDQGKGFGRNPQGLRVWIAGILSAPWLDFRDPVRINR